MLAKVPSTCVLLFKLSKLQFLYLKHMNSCAYFMELFSGPNWVDYRYHLLIDSHIDICFAF